MVRPSLVIRELPVKERVPQKPAKFGGFAAEQLVDDIVAGRAVHPIALMCNGDRVRHVTLVNVPATVGPDLLRTLFQRERPDAVAVAERIPAPGHIPADGCVAIDSETLEGLHGILVGLRGKPGTPEREWRVYGRKEDGTRRHTWLAAAPETEIDLDAYLIGGTAQA